ncbi:MAG TPA: hypothetical protein VHE14_09060 [Solirubrobacteraceae bacterium]|nr:hypothetical protein [Solirubrobacteraceae bacterium]
MAAVGTITTPVVGARLREALAATGIAGSIAAGYALAADAAAAPSFAVPWSHRGFFPGWLSGPLHGLGAQLDAPRFTVIMLVLLACCLLTMANAGAVRPKVAIGGIVVMHVIFLLAPPLLLADVFNYIDYARLGAVHGLNPYLHTPSQAPYDSIHHLVTWRHLTTPYGPLFTLGSYVLAPLSVPAAMWVVKAAVALASLGCVAMIWRLARLLGRPPVPAIMLYGLNPLVLVHAVGGAHNDVFALLVVLVGVQFVLREREGRAAGMMVAAAAIKASFGLALPFLIAGSSRRLRAAGGALVGAAIVGIVALIAFGSGTSAAFEGFGAQGHFVSPLSVPGQWAVQVLHQPIITQDVVDGARYAFVAITLGFLIRTWRGGDWIDGTGWALMALILALTWVMPWYIIWVLPFAALSANRNLRNASLALFVFLLLIRLPVTGF